jgi:hypothetical protein
VISTIVDGKRRNQFQLESQNFSTREGTIESGGVLLKKRRGFDNTFDAVIEEPQSDSDDGDEVPFGRKKRRLDESGLPLIPELMRYNDLFDLTRGKKKAREREKIYEVFSKIR